MKCLVEKMVWKQHQIFDGFSCLTYLRSSHNFLLKIGNLGKTGETTPICDLNSRSRNKLELNTDKFIQQMLSLLLFLPGKYRQILSLGGAEAFLKTFFYWEIERACLWYIRCLFSSPLIITHVDKFNTFKQRVISPKDHLKDARNAKVLNNVVAPYK